MADYYLSMQVAHKLGLSEREVAGFEAQGFLRAVHKDNRKFYSAKQVYRLQAALRLAQKNQTALDTAFAILDARHPSQPTVPTK